MSLGVGCKPIQADFNGVENPIKVGRCRLLLAQPATNRHRLKSLLQDATFLAT